MMTRMTLTVTEPEGFDPDDYEDPPARLPRGYLALVVYNICVQYAARELTLDEGKFLTPYIVKKIIMDEQPGKLRPPSTGAIAAVFDRWREWDFATFRKNPYAFVAFTDKGKRLGLDGITKERADLKKAAAQQARKKV